MGTIETEITVGPLTFEYDVEREELFVRKGENSPHLVEDVWADDWIEFVNRVQELEDIEFRYQSVSD